MAVLLDGKSTSIAVQDELAEKVKQMVANGKKRPHLAAILVGNDGASRTYVGAKVKACERIGFESTLITLEADITQDQLIAEVKKMNQNPDVDGFIVQLPLPKHLDEQEVIETIDPDKDVDGFHPTNVGRMVLKLPCYLPATPYGILQLISRYDIPTEGKSCVVVGRSHIVGSPMSILMAQNTYPGNCTVTMAHSRTKNLKELCLSADILIVALGRPEYITADMVKDGAVVIDVGITRVPDDSKPRGYRLAGDVDFATLKDKCSHITPVPGGVGPMTIASLLKNTMLAAERRSELVVN